GAGSSWITPSNNQATTYINGPEFFSTQFNLTGFDLSNVTISGYWLADDYGLGIFLNGGSVGQASLPVFGALGGPMTPFTIKHGALGSAAFNQGSNTLTFGMINDSTNHGTITGGNSPTGIRVVFTVAGTDPVPEPASIFLVGLGLGFVVWS